MPPAKASTHRVSTRGTYVGLARECSLGRYKAAYGNDDYQINRFISANFGLRWEQEEIGGSLLNYTFTDSWSPRLGINIDPMGDHKTKIFFNYARNYLGQVPLDAAIRQSRATRQDDDSPTSFCARL